MTVIEGIVERGDRRGRQLGFPTANIPIAQAKGLEGVWAGVVEMGQAHFAAAAVSIGRRRTFYKDPGKLLLEAHLLDVEEDLYGRHLRVHLLERLRSQESFADAAALVQQLRLDVAHTRECVLIHLPWLLAPAPGDARTGVWA